jgi:hypothetical protein
MGDYTIKQVLQITNKFYANRFTYKERDVVKRITIKEVKQVERHDIPGQPRVYTKYVIESKSWPQYPPYRPRSKTSRQRRIAHHYDVVFEIDRLSLNTKNWTSRVGSGKKWKETPPQSQIKTLYPRTKERFRRKAKGDRQEYKKLVERHKKQARYLDVGDYNSRVQGLNGDWIFRCDYAYYTHDHRFGRNYYGNVAASIRNPNAIVFFTKHQLNVIDQLMQKGILKDD